LTNTSLAFSASDWRLSDRFAGFTLIDLHGEWLRGQWWTVTVALLGFRLTLTRWLVVEEAQWGAIFSAVASMYGPAVGGYVDEGREKAP
jgi:hypothetical protein